jgi:FKBP-type peptidyl-prolyl cis-trans isomerase FkpA
MKRRLMFLALAAIGFAGCNGGLQKGEGGMLYNIIVDKPTPKIQIGDFVDINFVIKNDADSTLVSSYEMGHPVPQIMQKAQSKGDIYSALLLMSEGDSAVVKLNIDSLTKGRPRPAGVKGKYIVYTIQVVKVIQKGTQTDQAFAANYTAFLKTLSEKAKGEEPAKIKKYIADNNLKPIQTASGLNYVITQQGAGEKPVAGDTVVVNYTGKFTTGKAFETSVKAEAIKDKLQINPMNPYKPIRFALGTKGMIAGWEEGLQLLTKGSKATLILPSSLAYGQQGYQQIQPFTPLVFDVELVDIIHPNPNAPKPVNVVPPMPTALPTKK